MYNFLQGFNFGFAGSMFSNMFSFFSPCCFNFGGLFNTSIFGMNGFGFGFGNYNYDYGNSIFTMPQMSMQMPVQMPMDMSMSLNNMSFTNFNMPQLTLPAYTMPTLTLTNTAVVGTSTPRTTQSSRNTGSLEHWSKMSDARMKEIYGNYDFDITTRFEGTADDLNRFLNTKDGVLKGKGEVFIRAQEEYGINALAMIAICGAETSYGTRGNAVNGKYNIGNIRKNSSEWEEYRDADDAIMALARYLKNNYVDSPAGNVQTPVSHLTKLYQIASKYCPAVADGNDANWARNVQTHITTIRNAIA